MRLGRDISADLGFCGVEGRSGEAFGFLPSAAAVFSKAMAAADQRGRVAVRLAKLDRREGNVAQYRQSLFGIGFLCLESYLKIGAFAERITRRRVAGGRTAGEHLRSLRLLEASIPHENLRRLDECGTAFERSIQREQPRA